MADGNKRTAWNAAWLFLAYDGIQLADDFNVDEAEQLMNDAAQGAREIDAISIVMRRFADT